MDTCDADRLGCAPPGSLRILAVIDQAQCTGCAIRFSQPVAALEKLTMITAVRSAEFKCRQRKVCSGSAEAVRYKQVDSRMKSVFPDCGYRY
jgi:hypothetical protein